MVLKQPYKLKYNSMTVGVHVGLTGVLRGKRAQINLMNWPKGLVHIRHHHIMLINILPGKPLTAFIFICSKLSNSRGGIFFFFLTTVHLGAVKAANYCHHCPWKCITPHLRAHSIKETEGAINRWPPTFIERKNHQNKSWMRRLSRSHVANVSLASHLRLSDAVYGIKTGLFFISDWKLSCFGLIFISLIPAMLILLL